MSPVPHPGVPRASPTPADHHSQLPHCCLPRDLPLPLGLGLCPEECEALFSPEHPVPPLCPQVDSDEAQELLIPAATSVLWLRYFSLISMTVSQPPARPQRAGMVTRRASSASVPPQQGSKPTQGSLLVVTCSHLGVSSAPQSAAMAPGTRSRTPLFPHTALIHATEPRLLFGCFSSFLPLCSGTGELSPSQPLPPAVHPRGSPGLAGARPGRSGCPARRDAPAPSTPEGGRAGRGSAVTPRGEGSAHRDSDSSWETERWQSWETS